MFTTLISASELARELDNPDFVIVDCRFSLADPAAGRRQYDHGHIPGAVYAHLDDDLSGPIVPGVTGRHPLPDPARFAERLGAWGVQRETQVVAYDAADGSIAARLWWLLGWVGHRPRAVLDGGFVAWTAAGHPVTREPATPVRREYAASLHPELVVSAADVERTRERSDHRLLDARAPERFAGDVEPIDPVGGHIPGALSLPLGQNLEGGRFRSPAEMRQRFESALAGVPPERATAYCGSGVTACHLILAAEHAGLSGMRLYAGSWSEWITDPKRPSARGH